MRTDIPAKVAEDLITGNVDRYCTIEFLDGTIRYLSDCVLTVDGDNQTDDLISDWGARTFSGDISGGGRGDVMPCIERTFSLKNTERTGWIGDRVIKGSFIGATVSFYVRSRQDMSVWTEDILSVSDPVSLSISDFTISITAVSQLMDYENIFTGVYDEQSGVYTNIQIGKVDDRIGELEDEYTSPFTYLSSDANVGDTSIHFSGGAFVSSFGSSGNLLMDGVMYQYSSFTEDHFNLVSPLPRKHFSGTLITELGGNYYYRYGFGPIESNVSRLLVISQDKDYSGEFLIEKNTNPVRVYFPMSFPYRIIESSIIDENSRTAGVADFTNDHGAITSSLTVNHTLDFSGTEKSVHTRVFNLGDEITIPDGGEFVSATVYLKATCYKGTISDSGTTTVSKTTSDIAILDSYSAVDGSNKLYLASSRYDSYNQWITGGKTIGQFPSTGGWTVTGGKVEVSGGVFWNGVTMGKVEFSAGDSTSMETFNPIDDGVPKYFSRTKIFSGSSWTNGVFQLKCLYKVTGAPNADRPYAQVGVYKITLYLSSSSSSSYYGKISAYVFGQKYDYTGSSGEYSVDKTFTTTNVEDISGGKNWLEVYTVSSASKSETKTVARITEYKISVTYRAQEAGFPRHEIIPPDDTMLMFEADTNGATPTQCVDRIMFSNGIVLDRGQSFIDAHSYYLSRNFLCNGFIDGQSKINQALNDLSRQCAFIIFEQAGKIELRPRKIKELAGYQERFNITQEIITSGSISVEVQSPSDVINSLDCSYEADINLSFSASYHYEFIADGFVESQGEPLLLTLIDETNFAENTVEFWVERNPVAGYFVHSTIGPQAAVLEFGDYVNINLCGFCGVNSVPGEVVSISANYPNSANGTGLSYTVVVFCGGSAVSAGQHVVASDTINLSTDGEPFMGAHVTSTNSVSISTSGDPRLWDGDYAKENYGEGDYGV